MTGFVIGLALGLAIGMTLMWWALKDTAEYAQYWYERTKR